MNIFKRLLALLWLPLESSDEQTVFPTQHQIHVHDALPSTTQPGEALIPSDIALGGSCNTPNSRTCWQPGFNINTDYEDILTQDGQKKNIPKGVHRYFYLVATSGNLISPDGYEVDMMLFNKSYPGPLIEGNWGDTFHITVKNELTNYNGTSVHWHGIRQFNSNWYDGVSGVTECPIPPGEEFTYVWKATQYGTSWYHSHFSLQYADGLLGPLKIHGPTSQNYDIDLGPVLLTDHFHRTAFSQFYLELQGRPPAPDSMLLNGNGTYYCCHDCQNADPKCKGNSKRTDFIFERNKSYKMSLVNTGSATHMTFWIDNHDFSVVATDFVPIEPYVTDTLNIAIGQRYDIIINATAKRGDDKLFWMHVRDCANFQTRSNIGIIRYDADTAGNSTEIPWTPPPDPKRICYGCLDELSTRMNPIVKRTVVLPESDHFKEDDRFQVHLIGDPDPTDRNSALHRWVMANSSLYLDWTQPSLSLINIAGNLNWEEAPFPVQYAPVYLDQPDEQWVTFLIEGKFNDSLPNATHPIYKYQAPVAHPIHVHGHDFVILASNSTPYDPDIGVHLRKNNPPRRDVALLPVNGYLIIGFQINNPGAWLMHCHIANHASGGLAAQFIEKRSNITSLFKASGIGPKYSETCSNWGAYYKVFNQNRHAQQEDSGI